MSDLFSPRFVGTVHLPALPGSALGGLASDFATIVDQAKRDAVAYAEGGANALIVENFGDVPFVRDRVPAHVVAAMTLAVAAVHAETGLPVGVNVLRNDVLSAVSIAALTGARFVRANIYVGTAVTDQGLIEGRAAEVQALIRQLGANISVWADVDVKHAAPLAHRPIADQAEDAIFRGLAGAIIVTGRATGQPAALSDLEAVRAAIGRTPLYVGSGITAETIGEVLAVADGVIVGTAAKVDGIVSNPVDAQRVRAIVQAITRG